MDCARISEDCTLKVVLKKNNNYNKIEVMFIRSDKIITFNLDTFKTLNFMCENNIYSRVKCFQNKNSEIDIEKINDVYNIIHTLPLLNMPAIIFPLADFEMRDISKNFPFIMTKISEWQKAYAEMSHVDIAFGRCIIAKINNCENP